MQQSKALFPSDFGAGTGLSAAHTNLLDILNGRVGGGLALVDEATVPPDTLRNNRTLILKSTLPFGEPMSPEGPALGLHLDLTGLGFTADCPSLYGSPVAVSFDDMETPGDVSPAQLVEFLNGYAIFSDHMEASIGAGGGLVITFTSGSGPWDWLSLAGMPAILGVDGRWVGAGLIFTLPALGEDDIGLELILTTRISESIALFLNGGNPEYTFAGSGDGKAELLILVWNGDAWAGLLGSR